MTRDIGARRFACGTVAQPQTDAPRPDLRLPRVDSRRRYCAENSGFQGGAIEGPTHFSQFAPLLRTYLGQRLVRNRMLSPRIIAIPPSRAKTLQANIEKPKPSETASRDRHDQARRHRDFTRHRVGRRGRNRNGSALAAARRIEAAYRSRHPADLKVGMKTARQTIRWISTRTWATSTHFAA